MKNRKHRHQVIRDIIANNVVGSQEDLLRLLSERNFSLTQATLSRDLKAMKVLKQATENGDYRYIFPPQGIHSEVAVKEYKGDASTAKSGFRSIAFSGNMAVIKTRPAYASSIASDIDSEQYPELLGSIAGDDTLLLIIKENVPRETVIDILRNTIPDIHL
ncbi:MAG: hypothetical protein LBR81_04985 [Prevotellaceae bacterium]|jgi:transcriptional regulator of arginine metabolism|nr:hypothetical protein [Prevotellaceae bacterium]